jgi:hypothetical protein
MVPFRGVVKVEPDGRPRQEYTRRDSPRFRTPDPNAAVEIHEFMPVAAIVRLVFRVIIVVILKVGLGLNMPSISA